MISSLLLTLLCHIPQPSPVWPIPYDLDRNGEVGRKDLSLLVQKYKKQKRPVPLNEFAALSRNWGTKCKVEDVKLITVETRLPGGKIVTKILYKEIANED